MSLRSVLTFCLWSAAAFSQDFRATLTGTVTDPSGAAVPNASVKATNTGTNAIKEVKTTSDGVYTIPYLDPGVYDVEVTAAGFQQLKRSQITLQVAQKMNLPMQMTVGQMSQEITVTGQQEVIDTADASRGLVFDPIKVQQYPLNGRQTYMLMSLTPGVIFTQEQFGASGFSGTRGWDVNSSYKINGARPGNNLFLLNGAPISDNGGSWQIALNVEAVQEFKVMTNTYDAGYGRFQGGVVNTTMKGGTNAWHGDVFEYWRNRILDANSFQNNLIGTPRGFHNQHQFGGVGGGPIRKDKDFVLFSFEGWQEVVPFPANTSTPNMAMRDGQHFSQFGMTVYDPLTTHDCKPGTGGPETEPCSGNSGSTYWRNPFPGNVIPQNRISPIGQKILGYYPAENVIGALPNNFVASSNLGRYWYNQPSIRWDHVFGVNDKFYALYTFQHGYEYRSSTGYPKPAAQGNTDNERTDNNIIMDYTHVLNATSVLDVRASFGRFTQLTPGYNDQALKITAKDFGMTKMPHSPTSSLETVPAFRINPYQPIFGNGQPLGTWSPRNQLNFAPSLTLTRGTHTIRAGFEFNYYAVGNGGTGTSQGFFTFDSGWTRQATGRSLTSTDQFNAVASVLLGLPASGTIEVANTYYWSRPYYAGYIQDDWKVTKKLSINVGLRYDVQIPFLERYNRRNRGFDILTKNPLSDQILAKWAAEKKAYDANNPKYPYPDPPAVLTGQWLFLGANGQPRRMYDTDWTNLGPRFGIAYRFLPKTVLRAGFGAFYKSPTNTQTSSGLSQSTGYTTNAFDPKFPSACNNGGCLGAPTGPYSLVDPFPQGFASPLGAAGGALTAIGNGVSGYDPAHYKVPRTYQYSLGFQHELPWGIVAEVSFSGNSQVFETYGFDMNWPAGSAGLALQQKAIDDATFYSTSVNNPFYGILPITSSRGSSQTISRQSLMQLYPLWGGMTNNLMAAARYRSEELQTKVEKRAFENKGGVLTWVFSWTFGKEYEMNHRLGANWNTAEPLVYE
ncbi:MAG TPA: carboxypeptidase regulatory-like domain-containing protein, partial [Candidatus Solibacter sp.]|nr:carboxypeptidase regulatory-like domain-containing protein [Candidatus Solibacter sp.]